MQPHAVLLSSLIGVLYIVLLLYLDKYEREPLLRIGALFAASILVTGIYGGILTRGLSGDDEDTLFRLCVRTPLLEEGVKFGLFLAVYLLWRRWIDEPFDLIVYLGIVALGFSVQENIGYYFVNTHAAFVSGAITGDYSWYDRSLATIALRRGIPGHLMMQTVGAWVLSRGFRKPSFPVWFVAAYLVAVVAHACWNFTASCGITAFRFYVIPMAVATIVVVSTMRGKSQYWTTQEMWLAAVGRFMKSLEAAVATAREGTSPESRRLGEASVQHMKWILRSVRGLTIRPGTDQVSIFRALQEHLPDGPPVLDDRGLEDLDRRLRRIADVLGPYRSFTLHWPYWFGLLAIFASVGFFATILSLVLERTIVLF